MTASLATLTGELVERARQGDQNAMATIAEVREAAGKGGQKAKNALSHIMQYIKCNPFDAFHGEELERVKVLIHGEKPLEFLESLSNCEPYVAATLLADNPPNYKNLGKQLNIRERDILFHGIRSGRKRDAFKGIDLTEREKVLAQAGKVLCICRAIIDVRKPNARLRNFCPLVAWELGE